MAKRTLAQRRQWHEATLRMMMKRIKQARNSGDLTMKESFSYKLIQVKLRKLLDEWVNKINKDLTIGRD